MTLFEQRYDLGRVLRNEKIYTNYILEQLCPTVSSVNRYMHLRNTLLEISTAPACESRLRFRTKSQYIRSLKSSNSSFRVMTGSPCENANWSA